MTSPVQTPTADCSHCRKPIRANRGGIWGARKRDDPHPWYCDANPDAGKRHAPAETPLDQLDEHLIPEGAHWTPEGPHGELWAVRWYSDMGIVEAVGYPRGSGEFHGEADSLPAARREALRIAGLISDGQTREA